LFAKGRAWRSFDFLAIFVAEMAAKRLISADSSPADPDERQRLFPGRRIAGGFRSRVRLIAFTCIRAVKTIWRTQPPTPAAGLKACVSF
jgi:hypothetical protein